MKLNLPDGATIAFRWSYWDAFENRFVMHLYGAKQCWFMASRQAGRAAQPMTTEPTRLQRAEWRMFLGFLKQMDFWNQPAREDRADVMFDDGQWIALVGNDGARLHGIQRTLSDQRIYSDLENFLRRLSGLFPEYFVEEDADAIE